MEGVNHVRRDFQPEKPFFLYLSKHQTWNFRTFFRNLSGKNWCCRLVFIGYWHLCYHTTNKFLTGSVLENEKSLLKWKLNIKISVIFSLSKMAAVWKSWRNYHVIWHHHFTLWTSKGNTFGRSIYTLSFMAIDFILAKLWWVGGAGGSAQPLALKDKKRAV